MKLAAPLPIAGAQEKSAAEDDIAEGTVSVTFTLQYGLDDGVMVITGKDEFLGRSEYHRAPKMRRQGGEQWELTLELPRNKDYYTYNYVALARQPRAEAMNAPRTVSIKGLKAGDRCAPKAENLPAMTAVATS